MGNIVLGTGDRARSRFDAKSRKASGMTTNAVARPCCGPEPSSDADGLDLVSHTGRPDAPAPERPAAYPPIRASSFGRAALLVASAGALAGWAVPAAAQDSSPQEEGSAAGVASDEGTRIVVTGSRLATTGMDSPVPVTAVSAEQLETMDPGALISAVSQLPQFYGNSTPNNSNFFLRGGTGNLNLRGLGPNRTLTLLNGRRFPSSSAFGGVDINLFPEAMISGIETVTGGASAAYGTDAVAGVVNFLLNTKFTGIQADIQGGVTDRGDGANYEMKLSAGTNIGERGHVLVSAAKAEQQGIHSLLSRDWYTSTGAIQVNGVWTDFPNVHSTSASFSGIISSPNAAINGLAFDKNGNYAPFVAGSPAAGQVGAAGANAGYASGGSGDDLASGRSTLYPDTDRYSLFAYADYELFENFTVFAQFVRGYNHQFQYNGQPSLYGQPTAITIFQDNAFLPASLRQIMVANNIPSFNLRRAGITDAFAGANTYEDATTQNVGTVGFDANLDTGGFLDGWKVSGYYQYGHSRRVWDQYSLRIDRIFAAVDAVRDTNGNIVCRVSTVAAGAAAFPGCQPLNLFGQSSASGAAVDYVMGNDVGVDVTTPLYFANLGYTGDTLSYTSIAPKRNITTFEQHFAEVSASGDLFTGWAGPISLAVGASYREESIYQVVQDTANRESNHDGAYHPCSTVTGPALGLRGLNPADCNNTVAFQFSKVSNIQGSATVKEGFAETLIPLFDNGKGLSAIVDLAGRYADYSGSGGIWAYKGGVDVSLFEGLRLRGTYSRDVRAGNLSERFDKTGGSANVLDSRTVAQNPAWGGKTYNTTIFSGGNPAIKPESADTYTAGLVFQPKFLSGFSVSVDYYLVSTAGAIATVGNNEVVRRCFQDNDQQFCDLVTLDPADSNKIILVGNQYVNVAVSRVEGIDAEIGYRTDLDLFGGGDERLAGRLFLSYLIDRSDIGATGTATEFDGLTGINPTNGTLGIYPKFKATGNINYSNGPFSMNVQGRLIGSGKRTYLIGQAVAREGVNIADNSSPSVFYADLRLAYDFETGGPDVQLWASVTNLFDKDPPVNGYYSTFAGSVTQFNAGLYDVLGRRYTIGAKLKF